MRRLGPVASACALAVAVAAATPAASHQMAAIDESGQLIVFSSRTPSAIHKLNITAADARIVGIDVRPADGILYGVSAKGTIYRIDPGTGATLMMSRMNLPLEGTVAVVDFNPVLDRLRVITAEGRGLCVNVETGETTEDGRIGRGPDGPFSGVTGGGYTNSARDATTTRLWRVDGGNHARSSEDPAHPGRLVRDSAIALTGAAGELRGGDVVTDTSGHSAAYVVRGAGLYRVELATGRVSSIGQVGAQENLDLVDVAVTRVEGR